SDAARPRASPMPPAAITGDGTRDVEYALVGGSLVANCNGDPITSTSPCVVEGAWVADKNVTFVLPSGVDAAQVVGVRFMAQRMVDGVQEQWERPYNPRLNYVLKTERRDTLRSDPATQVSTTRPGLAPNPGETLP